MKPRLFLTSAPVSIAERYGQFSGAANTQPSFGLVCLAAAAIKTGAETAVLDAAANNLSIDAAIQRILSFKPCIVGISATTVGIVAAGKLAELIKQSDPGILILIGGCHASALPAETLDEFKSFDYVVFGEGEETLAEMLNHISSGNKHPSGISGTAERINGKATINPPRPVIDNLDDLPMPAWHLLENFPQAYKPSPGRIRQWPCASVVLTRGCPNQCTFCDRSVFGRRCRAYSPAYAMKIVKDLHDNFGVREILIEDDTFIISSKRVTEFCELLIAAKLDISWSCLGRADTANEDVFRLMRRAGCWHISFGIESGSAIILEKVHKNLDKEQIRKSIDMARRAGLKTKGFFMVGFPGETRETINETSAFAASLNLDDISVMQLTPFPGSELYEEAPSFGAFDKDWRKMNTISTVFTPHGFSVEDLENARSSILKSFYFRPSVLWKQFLTTVANPGLLRFKLPGLMALLRNVR